MINTAQMRSALYELFMGPLEDGCEWETGGVAGTRRFLDRVWRLAVDVETGERAAKLVDEPVDNPDLERALHAAIKRSRKALPSSGSTPPFRK